MLENLNFGELMSGGAIALAAFLSLVEIAPIKINPWTNIARAIGKAINGEVLAKVEALEQKVDKLEHAGAERNAESRRVRILRFGDEILHDVKHSKEHFDNIHKDISVYEQYCKDHPEFENGRTVLTIEVIEATYKKCLDHHTFL
jgi:hypothetical protein